MYLFPILLVLIIAPLMAQQETLALSPSPSPEVAVTPATDATPPPVASSRPEVSPSPSPSPEATPEASPSPSPSASPSPAQAGTEDVIPLPPEAGTAETPIVSESEVPGLSKPGLGEPLPDSAFTDPNAVIPSTADTSLPPAPAGPSAEEIERKIKVRYQEVRTQVEKDPEVRSLFKQANNAKTFEDERAALREYYRLLFAKMKKVDKELTSRCEKMEKAYVSRLAQSRLEPTIPLNPPPTPEPLSE